VTESALYTLTLFYKKEQEFTVTHRVSMLIFFRYKTVFDKAHQQEMHAEFCWRNFF
jgi:hypothetical protein